MDKIGDFLLCKEDFYYKEKLIYEKGKCYQISNFELGRNIIVHFVNCEYALWYENEEVKLDTDYEHWYIWKYFYTLAEWRDKQIDNILDDTL